MNNNDYIFNYDNETDELTNFDKSDLIYKIEKNQNIFSKKILLYNEKSKIPLQKYWICLKNCKILNVENNIITIALATKKYISKLIYFMDNITNCIRHITTFDNEAIKFTYDKKNINVINKLKINTNFVPTMELLYDNKLSIFDTKNTKYNISNIKNIFQNLMNNSSLCDLIIELENININGNTATPQWKILQLQEINMVDENKYLLSNENNNPSYNSINSNIIPINNNISNNSNMLINNIPINNNNPISKLNITKNSTIKNQNTNSAIQINNNKLEFEIKNALQNLKKIGDKNNENNNSEKNNKIILSNFIMPTLKKVITKESISFVEILRRENNLKKKINLDLEYTKIKKINKNFKKLKKINLKIHDINKHILNKH
jgi:hypothetical protein